LEQKSGKLVIPQENYLGRLAPVSDEPNLFESNHETE
jgi:hypothetical protein